MSRKSGSTKKSLAPVECCICIRRITKKSHHITSKYARTKKESIYDVLEKLNLLNYGVIDVEGEVICEACRKIVVDFYNFKLMCENQQGSHRVCIREKECDEQIIDLLEPGCYETLKDFISQFPHSSIFIDDEHQLIIRPSNDIKNKSDSEQVNFIDFQKTDVAIKTEDDENDYQTLDDTCQTNEVASDSDADYQQENDTEALDDDDEDEPSEENEAAEMIMEEGVNKTVLDNIEFISRTPECLVDLMKKKQRGDLPPSTSKCKNPANWIRIKQRTARSKGESYVSRSGKFIRARAMKAPCSNCRYKCCEKITEAERLRNFTNYWGLADFVMQKKFLFQHRVVEPVARRRARQENPRVRAYSTKYFLDTFNEDGSVRELVKVCESMFTGTLDICKNTIRTLQKKVEMGKVEDLRGQQRRKLSPGHLVALDHIRQFPYFHIEKPMPLSQMFKLYRQECVAKGIEPVGDGTYRKLFSDNNECEFLRQNNKFKCVACDEYNQANDFARISLEFAYQHHLETNVQCKQRARWRKSGKLKAERRKLMREQMQQQHHHYHPSEMEFIQNDS